AWSPISASGPAPSARGFMAAVMDEASQRMVTYGGLGDGPLPIADPTYSLRLGSAAHWSPLRPLAGGTPDHLELCPVTVGDTLRAGFTVVNEGMQTLNVSDIEPHGGGLSVSDRGPFALSWLEARAETLVLTPTLPDTSHGSLVIVSDDPIGPR